MMEPAKKVFFFIVIQRMVYFAAFAADEESHSRSAYFTTRENKRLQGYVVKRYESPSLMSCSQLCLRNSWCTSTNFEMSSKDEDKGTCELNKHNISVINEETEFHDQEDVTFSLLLKVSWPVIMRIILLLKFNIFVTRNINITIIISGLLYGCYAIQFLAPDRDHSSKLIHYLISY